MGQPASKPDSLLAFFEDGAFSREQERLGTTWHCVGRVMDLRQDKAWIRSKLGGRSIFIQRFGDKLKGFENHCVHRGFPLRNEDRGRGPIVCGFHHWRYDSEGRARGIPNCVEMFGKTPRELDLRLQPVDVDTCGGLVFARLHSEAPGPSLREHLGASHDIVAALTAPDPLQRTFMNDVRANWRLIANISLDDYHIVAVHPSSFGRSGYLKPDEVTYHRDGIHSAFFAGQQPETIEAMAESCRSGSYIPRHYRTLYLFPNLVLSHTHAVSYAGASIWYVIGLYYIPQAADRTALHVFYQPSPFSTKGNGIMRAGHDLIEGVRSRVVGYYTRKVVSEDNEACERLQTNARYFDSNSVLAAQEQRISWFEESYRQHVMR